MKYVKPQRIYKLLDDNEESDKQADMLREFYAGIRLAHSHMSLIRRNESSGRKEWVQKVIKHIRQTMALPAPAQAYEGFTRGVNNYTRIYIRDRDDRRGLGAEGKIPAPKRQRHAPSALIKAQLNTGKLVLQPYAVTFTKPTKECLGETSEHNKINDVEPSGKVEEVVNIWDLPQPIENEDVKLPRHAAEIIEEANRPKFPVYPSDTNIRNYALAMTNTDVVGLEHEEDMKAKVCYLWQ